MDACESAVVVLVRVVKYQEGSRLVATIGTLSSEIPFSADDYHSQVEYLAGKIAKGLKALVPQR